jgi:beta-lactamase superfamily II metal-dependent hydrolase
MTQQLYNGLEVDMLSVGNADAILVTEWSNSNAVRILIDGGNTSDAEKVLAKLQELRVGHLHHVICTHPHDDHASGLIGVLNSKAVTIGQFWMHLPWAHINFQQLTATLSRAGQAKVANIVRASLDTSQQLYHLAVAKKIPIAEPFDKTNIGPLYVCGPTVDFYRALLLEFSDLEKLQNYETALAAHERKVMAEDFLSGVLLDGRPAANDDGELGGARTEPENYASVILTAAYNGARFLFTADAGVPALNEATSRYVLSNLNWMQIPHHGSRRNLTVDLVKYFKPAYAFVSADGGKKHPRRKVVNAFKEVGAKVYSTHHPTPRPLRHFIGLVPERAGYEVATPL